MRILLLLTLAAADTPQAYIKDAGVDLVSSTQALLSKHAEHADKKEDREVATEEKIVEERAKKIEHKENVVSQKEPTHEAPAAKDDDHTRARLAKFYEDGSYVKWLWCLLIVYMFYAQATICDEYFVESIKVVCDVYKIPGDVAGATLMALGCNGPELFTNFISIFITHSDVGVGTIVGSEIFNMLCIVGGAILASPITPLEVKKVSFIRDCLFYFASCILLAWVLQDGIVTQVESIILCCGCVIFALTVCFTARMEIAMGWVQEEEETAADIQDNDEVLIKTAPENRLAGRVESAEICRVSADEHGITVNHDVDRPGSKKRGSLLGRTSNKSGTGLQESLMHDSGEVEYSDVIAVHRGSACGISLELASDMGSTRNVKITCANDHQREDLIHKIETYGHKEITAVKSGVDRVVTEFSHSMRRKDVSCMHKVFLVISVPVELIIGATVGWCDVRVPTKRHLWPAAFGCSMIWLGIFSFLMCMAADGLHKGFGISQAVLGVTVCAVGTSFPNFWASILMARDGRADMAIANALGSNVQNVFLALAVPWLVRTSYPVVSDFPVAANGIMTGVMWMAGTELLVFMVCFLGGWTMNKFFGYLFFVVYLCYVWVATH